MAFAFYKTLTIDHTQVPNTDQTSFPVLVSFTDANLKTVGNGGHVQNASGFDIGFYSDVGLTTKLPWETEVYTAASGLVIYWVNIPTVATASNTVFYMAYGDATITTDQSNKTGTWNTNFKGVYHLQSDYSDSSSVASSLTSHGGTPTAGQIGNGLSLNGTTQYGNRSSSWVTAEPLTMTAWINASNGGVQISNLSASGWDGWYMSSNYAISTVTGNFTNSAAASQTGTPGTFQYIAAVVASSTSRKIAVNGVFGATNTTSIVTVNPHNVASIGMAYHQGVIDNFFAGVIDEVRISNVARSDDWLATEYANQQTGSTFLTEGAETPVGGSTAHNLSSLGAGG